MCILKYKNAGISPNSKSQSVLFDNSVCCEIGRGKKLK